MKTNPDLPTSNRPDLASVVNSPELSDAQISGMRIGKYEIIGRLGVGGMGVVYKALDTQLQRIVALKFLPQQSELGDKEKQNLLREARAASGIDHPNVGVIYGIEETADHQLFIVMAYYDGETLAKKIESQVVSSTEAIDIARQTAAGLACAHEHHVVHGDIKPSNIIITAQGVVKIVDFGIARKITATAATQTGGIGGTVGYVSPEQALGKNVDQRSDIWSLGVVLYEMIVRQSPFQRDSTASILLAILNAPPANMQALPEAIQPIVYRALSKNPAHRFQSCNEFLDELNRLDLGQASVERVRSSKEFKRYVEAASKSSLQLPTVEPRKSNIWIAVLAALLLIVIGGIAIVPSLRKGVLRSVTESRQKHIAVLPFETLGDTKNQVLSDGLMDSLTSKLSNLDVGEQSLWVVPASEVRRKKINDPASAQKEFGATLVVTGSVLRDEHTTQLTVNLIDARDMRQLGSAVLEDPTGDFSSLQNQAVSNLARLMNIEITPEMLRNTGGSVVPAAYESYLKGLGYLQRWDKPGNLDAAIAIFNEAAQSDPRFALAYASLGEANRLKFKQDSNPQWIEAASRYCQRAAELNDQLPAVHVTLGRIHADTSKQDLALEEFQHALKLDSRNADALLGLAGVYEKAGRLQDAESTLQKAASLRPDYWDGFSKLGAFYYRQQRFAEAEKQYRRVIELTPDSAQSYSNLAVMLQNQKKYSEAEQTYKKSIELNPTYAAYTNLGTLYWDQQRYMDFAAMTEKALQFNDKDYRTWGNLGLAYDWLHDDQKARGAFERELPLLESAVKLKPEDAKLQSDLGVLYAKLKRHDDAVVHMQAALARSPNDGQMLSDIGEAYETLGDRKKALLYIKRSLQHGADLEALKRNPHLQDLFHDPQFKAPR